MIEVRPGVLLGSMGDALAVVSRARSIRKQYKVTHVLTLCNERPEWNKEEEEGAGDGISQSGVSGDSYAEQDQGDCDPVSGEGGASVKGEGGDGVTVRRGQDAPERLKRDEEMQTMFVQVADMPSSDLLHHFEPCCQFIKQATQHGTVLVHCEYGVSRSVTVVLAYLMWSEGLSYSVLYKDLKERKPEIRPNPGFVEQLKLWGAMRCRIDRSNKQYKAYRLKHLAREMKSTGCVEGLVMAPDPFLTELESSVYFKCRKCRRLLFTDENVLRHQIGKGQAAFKWHKRRSPNASLGDEDQVETQDDTPVLEEASFPADQTEAAALGTPLSVPADQTEAAALGTPLSVPADQTEAAALGTPLSVPADQTEAAALGTPLSVPADQTEEAAPPPSTVAAELAEVRAQVAAVVSLRGHSSSGCSSHFVDPVEWMGSLVLGSVEGKILCPKCSAKVGSFNWAGEQCSCGQWVTPSFQVHKNKLDETTTLVRRKNATKPS